MRMRFDRKGYRRVTLHLAGKRHDEGVHRLVLLAWGPSTSEPDLETRHLDGDPLNNFIGNLCWGTRRENAADRTRHGRSYRGEANGWSKLTAEQVTEMRQAYRAGGVTQAELARRFGVSRASVSMIVRGLYWSHIPEVAA